DIKTHSPCFTLASRQGQNSIEPIDVWVGSLEPHYGPEIIRSRIDIVAPRQPFHCFWGPVPNPIAGDHDACAGLCFNDVARFDIGSTVGADDLPIGASRKDAAIELWSVHAAAEDAYDTPLAIGRTAETGDAFEFCRNRENGLLSEHDGNPLEPQLLAGDHLTLPMASRKYGTQPGSHFYGAYYLARRSH